MATMTLRLALAASLALPALTAPAQESSVAQPPPPVAPVPPAAAPAPPRAPPQAPAPAPEPPRWRIGATAGAGWAFGDRYFIGGASVGYRALGGLEVGLDAYGWFGATPSILKLAPRLTYAVPMGRTTPYAGVYYARWMLGSGYADLDAVGGRAGVFQYAGRGGGFGVGVAYEHLLGDCAGDCDAWSPEILASFSF